jgi:hypothetical protein
MRTRTVLITLALAGPALLGAAGTAVADGSTAGPLAKLTSVRVVQPPSPVCLPPHQHSVVDDLAGTSTHTCSLG